MQGTRDTTERLNDFTFTFHFHALEKEMATHSSVLAWRIPWTKEAGGLQSMGSQRVRHDWTTNTHTHTHTPSVCLKNPKESHPPNTHTHTPSVCLKNPKQSETTERLTHTHTHTHTPVCAWIIQGTGEPGGLPTVGLHRFGHDWSDLAAAPPGAVRDRRDKLSDSQVSALRPLESQMELKQISDGFSG